MKQLFLGLTLSPQKTNYFSSTQVFDELTITMFMLCMAFVFIAISLLPPHHSKEVMYSLLSSAQIIVADLNRLLVPYLWVWVRKMMEIHELLNPLHRVLQDDNSFCITSLVKSLPKETSVVSMEN